MAQHGFSLLWFTVQFFSTVKLYLYLEKLFSIEEEEEKEERKKTHTIDYNLLSITCRKHAVALNLVCLLQNTGKCSRHCASCILGKAFHYFPENAFYIFNQQIYFII